MLHHRHATRLTKHDYSVGTYFITIGTHKHGRIFGVIKNNIFIPNILSKIVTQYLKNIPTHFSNTKIIASQLMPNHLHFILKINNTVGVSFMKPNTINKSRTIQHMGLINQTPTLGQIVRYLKAKSTFEIRKLPINPFFVWQRNYYEHIIRDKQDLFQKIQYIKNNPINWSHDPENKHLKLQ